MPKGVRVDVDADDLVRRYLAGETADQLMTAFGIGHPRLKKILSDRGIRSRTSGEQLRKLTEAEVSEMIGRYVAGEDTKAVGAAFGISGRGVTDYLRRAGVQARPRSFGITTYRETSTHEQRSAIASASMYKRWANATPEQRAAMLDPAHDAVRGVPWTSERKVDVVQAKERRSGSDSPYEEQVAEWLRERGVTFRQQVAIGEYCADFTLGPVAVEFTTGWARKKNWHPRFASFFDAGWHLYVIWHDTREPLRSSVADDLVAWTEVLQRTPPERSQHRVIWRSRQILSTGGQDADYVAGVLKSSTPRGSWPLYPRARHQAV